MMMPPPNLHDFLWQKVKQYNTKAFIHNDPICIPHAFTAKADIEIAGLFAALFAWGNRKAIIQAASTLLAIMQNQPYQFIMQWPHATETAKTKLQSFVYRTCNSTDVLYLIEFLHHHYSSLQQPSLETAFAPNTYTAEQTTELALNTFYKNLFDFALPEATPQRTRKHIAAPVKKSACKRLNMYLRWMVRSDCNGVDFGLWKNIQPHQLVMPLDVHVVGVATRLGLLSKKPPSWQAAVHLTQYLKQLSPTDPVVFDYAFFGLGVEEKFR